MQRITPFLWFDDKAEEAVNFYISVFKNSKIGTMTRYGEGGPGPKGAVMSATFSSHLFKQLSSSAQRLPSASQSLSGFPLE